MKVRVDCGGIVWDYTLPDSYYWQYTEGLWVLKEYPSITLMI